MKTLLILLSLTAAQAADVSISNLASIKAVGFNDGGSVACQINVTNPWCVWSNPNITGQYELYTAQLNSSTGQLMGVPTCMTCANEPSLIGYANGTQAWGQPNFDPTGTQLFLNVQNCAILCGSTPGVGKGFDVWVLQFNAGVLSNQNGASCSIGNQPGCLTNSNITQISNAQQGSLKGTLDGTHLWTSYIYGLASTGACSVAKYAAREWAYTIVGGNFTLGAENTAVITASKAQWPCAYIETQAYDPYTQEEIYQVAPGTTAGTANNNYWNNAFYGISAFDQHIDEVISFTTGGCMDWMEHANFDPLTSSYLRFSSAHNSTATAYSSCATSGFVTVPLDAYLAQVTRTGCVVGNTPECAHLSADAEHAVQLTFFNTALNGSADRALGCSLILVAGCSGSNTQINLSFGVNTWPQTGYMVNELKVGSGQGALLSFDIALGTRPF